MSQSSRKSSAYDMASEAIRKLKQDNRFCGVFWQPEYRNNSFEFLHRHTRFRIEVTRGTGRATIWRTSNTSIVGSVDVDSPTFEDDLCRALHDQVDHVVRINEYGERLVVERGQDVRYVFGTKHVTCGGRVQSKNVSETHYALHCETCNLRLVVPKMVITVDDLKRHFAAFNGEEENEPELPGIVFQKR